MAATASLRAAGGALAIGYDFHSRFDIPARTELEYAAFGQIKADRRRYDASGTWMIENKLGIQSLFVNIYHDFH